MAKAESGAPCILVSVPNWLGDGIMAMPALQAFRETVPHALLTAVVKPGLAALWRMHPAIDECVTVGSGLVGTLRTVRALRARSAEAIYILPNSMRSALVPLLAGVSRRIGHRGHRPAWMLTETVAASGDPDEHQAVEYTRLFGVAAEAVSGARPMLQVPDAAAAAVDRQLDPGARWVAVMPGAAYGPSKRWPAERFTTVARRAMADGGRRVVLLGTAAEALLCREVAATLPSGAVNLAGATSLEELAAVLARCECLVCNDSGGMHLAAAVGTPVVAIFGITDPRKTGPLGSGHRVLQHAGVRRTRDLARDSDEARAALDAIDAEQVWQGVAAVLRAGDAS